MAIIEGSSRTSADPQRLRDQEFSVRMRGLDQQEVYDLLDQVADDLERTQQQLAHLGAENARLHDELARARTASADRSDDQAAVVMAQAQQVADSLIEEAVRSAQEMLRNAQHQQRGLQVAPDPGRPGPSTPGVAYVRAFARAQRQLKSVLDALSAEVDQLEEPAGSSEPAPLFDAADPLGMAGTWQLRTVGPSRH